MFEKLKGTLEYTKGKKPTLIEYSNEDTLPYLSAEYLRNNKLESYVDKKNIDSKYHCNSDDLLIIWDGSNSGEVFMGKPGVLSSTMAKLKIKDKKYTNKYLYYFLKQKFSILNEKVTGAAIPHLNKAVLENLEIYSATQSEQQEIVQVLDTMSNIIRLREECISHAQDLIPALFQEMFKNYENNTILLSSICDIKGGKRLPSGEKLIDAKTEHPYLRVTNFKNQNIDMNDIKYITEDVYKKISRYVITTGDIYISMAGTIGLVGDIPNELNNANLTENAARLIIDKKKVNKKYLIYCLNSTFLQQQIKEATVGVGVPKLALSRIGTLKIYLPDIKIQEQFAQKAIEIESYIKEQNEELENAKQMFQSLLHHAFTGELTRRAYEN